MQVVAWVCTFWRGSLHILAWVYSFPRRILTHAKKCKTYAKMCIATPKPAYADCGVGLHFLAWVLHILAWVLALFGVGLDFLGRLLTHAKMCICKLWRRYALFGVGLAHFGVGLASCGVGLPYKFWRGSVFGLVS